MQGGSWRFLLWVGLATSCAPGTSTGDSRRDAAEEVPPQAMRFIDFGGKVQLLGFDLDAAEKNPPGSSVTLNMYWRRTGALRGDWRLFTHLANDNGSFQNFDRTGSLREASRAPENWALDKIYVDTQTLKIPEQASEDVTVLVGVWQGPFRLPVLSGPCDAENRGIVVHLKTR